MSTIVAASASPAARTALGASGHDTVRVDGIRLAFDESPGPEPAVVCLHAIGHGAGDFAGVRAHLRGRHRVLALDWPGQGRSEADRVPPSAERYAELLDGFLDATGVARPVVVGNSIGGAAAIRVAATHPDRIRALVLENPGGLDAPDALARTAIGLMVRFFDAGVRRAAWFPAAFGVYYRLVLPLPAAAGQRARVVAAGPEMAALLRDAWRSFGEPAADLRALAGRVACPVLFAWATRDRFVQLRRSRAGIARFPNATLETFPAGHAAHLETPDAFQASLDRFMARL